MSTIIIPAAIVAVIGLIAAIILTIASKLMYVTVDERVAAIWEVLPGATAEHVGLKAAMIMPQHFQKIRGSVQLCVR